MARRRRTRRRGGSPWRTFTIGLLLVLAAIVAGVGSPMAAFSTASVDRGSSVNVVADDDAVLTLNVSESVQTGSTERLLSLTDYTGRDINVTVALVGADPDAGALLLDGTGVGDTAEFALDRGATRSVSLETPCDDALPGTSAQVRVSASAPGFHGSVERSVPIRAGDCAGDGAVVVYAAPDTGGLRSVTDGASVRTYEPTGVSVLGPRATDLDGDGAREVPFVNASDTPTPLLATDANGGTTRLVDSGVAGAPSLVWVGTWNDSATSVFYANATDSRLYRATPSAGAVLVSDEVKAAAVAGAADVDGDGARELVYAGTSQTVKYVDDDGTAGTTGHGAGQSGGLGLGEPADFDGDGTARVPYVDGSNNLLVTTADGTTEKLVSGGVAKASPAAADIDGDGSPEVVYVGKSQQYLHYADDVASGGTVRTLTDAEGAKIRAATDTGVA